jgi:hypothetical protein
VSATGPIIVLAVLLLGLAIAIWSALRARTGAAEARQALGALQAHTFIAEFEADTVYRLLAKSVLRVGKQDKSFGVVERQDGTVVPFFSVNRMDSVESGECFAAVRGHIVKIDPAALHANAGKAVQASPPQGRMIPRVEDDDDATQHAPLLGGDKLPEAAAMLIDLDQTQPHHRLADTVAEQAPDGLAVHEDLGKTRIVAVAQKSPPPPVDSSAGLTYLKCVAGSDEGSSFRLPFDTASIGRGKDSTVSLSDEASSRVHCFIGYQRQGFVLRDNGSTNGTYCNNERVIDHFLEFGDCIKVANTDLVFTCDGYEFQNTDPDRAISAFRASVASQPDFLAALKILAFLLEKDVALQAEAQPLWARIAKIEKSW